MGASIPLLLTAASCLVLLSIKRIPEGQAYTVHRFGRYRRTLDSGVHWIMPLVERVAARINLTGRALQLAPRDLTICGMPCSIRGSVWFQVLDPARADAELDHVDDVVLREVLAAMDRLCEKGHAPANGVDPALKHEANLELRSHGIVVTRCQLLVETLADAA
jgi:regulator of protease activity HflC (stomatin/prohibitin superfamily)